MELRKALRLSTAFGLPSIGITEYSIIERETCPARRGINRPQFALAAPGESQRSRRTSGTALPSRSRHIEPIPRG